MWCHRWRSRCKYENASVNKCVFMCRNLWNQKIWSPNSPDLDPVDYSIWRALQQLVYCNRRIWDVEHLKEVLQTCWEQIGQDVIDHAIGQFRKRLSFVVADWAPLWLMFLLLHVHFHTYVFCCRNTVLGRQQQYIVRFILRQPVFLKLACPSSKVNK